LPTLSATAASTSRIREGKSEHPHYAVDRELENSSEYAGPVPVEEWYHERDANRISEMHHESARRVRDSVTGRIEANRTLDRDFAHPIQLLQFCIFHEGYHHGLIKSALKSADCPIADTDAGPVIWDVWRAR
jgi:hypothetical protein